MPNITLSIDEKTLQRSREYAAQQNTSLNALIREMLEQRIGASGGNWASEFFARSDGLQINSGGATWARKDLYDV